MITRKFLTVDDNPWVQSILLDLLRQIPNSQVVECSGRESALANIHDTFFDVCFIDLMLHNFEDTKAVVYEGIPLIEEIRRREAKSVIVAYSSALIENEELHSKLYNQCLKAGANVVISRASLITASSILQEKIDSWIEERRRAISGGRQLEVFGDIATKAAVEVIGDWNIKVILEDVLPRMSKDLISALDGGFSGAFVLRVHSTNSAGILQKNVLKLSRYEYVLENEFRRRPAIGSHHERSSVSAGTNISKRVDGWRGIIFREIIGAMPLSEYLKRTELTGIVQRTLDKVVRDVYIIPATDARILDSETKPEEEYKLRWKAGADLEKSLNSISSMSAVIAKTDRDSATIIRDYLMTVINGRASLVTTGMFATLHGDLHAQNVFVQDDSAPTVIDFERSDSYPRLFDIAALHVDLLISRLDSGGGADWDFKRLDIWEKWALGSFPFRNDISDEKLPIRGVQRIQYIRNALVKDMRQSIEGVSMEEYGRAFLFQVARYLKFPTVSIPKKLLAIRLARRLLKNLRLV